MFLRKILSKIPGMKTLARSLRKWRQKFYEWRQAKRPLPSAEALREHYSTEEYRAHKRDREHISEELIRILRETLQSARRVADFGCADGLVGLEIKKMGKQVIGFDFSPRFIEQAKINLGPENVIECDLCALPENAPRDFDAIWCSEVVEHIREPERLLASAWKSLLPEGILVLTFPTATFTGRNPYWDNIDKHLWCFTREGLERISAPWFSPIKYEPARPGGEQYLVLKKRDNMKNIRPDVDQ